MKEKIQYVFYEEKDTEKLLEMLKRNKFYLARLKPTITVEEFLEVQRKRGFLFAGVAKVGEEVISYMAVYHNGCLKIAKSNQVYISSMLIDREYQRALFTLMDLYSVVMSEILRRGYTDVVAEVNYTNLQSLFLLRKFGFILMNNKEDLYENLVLHNYIFGLIKLAGVDNITDLNVNNTVSYLPLINKKAAKEEDQVYYGKYIEQKYKCLTGKMTVLINIHTGYACGIEFENVIRAYTVNGESGHYMITNKKNSNLVLRYERTENGKVIKEEMQLASAEERELVLGTEVEKIALFGEDLEFPIHLYPREDVSGEEEERTVAFNENQKLYLNTGFLEIYEDEKLKMQEMWPCITYPYLVGNLIPKMYNLTCENRSDGEVVVTEETEQFTLIRVYQAGQGGMRIHTYAKLKDETMLVDPIFHFMLGDLTYECRITTAEQEVVKKYDPEDKVFCNEEVIYQDFIEEPFTKELLQEIGITYADKKYKITMDKPGTCFYQFNYIGIKVCKQSAEWENGWKIKDSVVDFGTITLEEVYEIS